MKYLHVVMVLVIAQCMTADASDQPPREKAVLLGKVTDEAGKPLAGARVDISTAAPKVGPGIFCPSCYLDCRKWTTTNELGEFELKSLDPGLKFRLVATAPMFRTKQTDLVDPASDALSITLAALPKDLDPARIVSGIVVDEVGTPIAGAFVEPYGGRTAERRWWGRVDDVEPVVTDHQGQFAMILPPGMLALDIEVIADGFCGVQVLLLEPGTKPAEVKLSDGARVTGRLVRDGQPVAGMSIAVVQTERGVGHGIFIAAVGDITRTDGSFEFKNLPTNQQYAIYTVVGDAKLSNSDSIIKTKTFKVPGSGESRDLGALAVTSPVTVRGKLQRIDNQPLPDNLKLSFGREPAWDLIGIPVDPDGTFEATGLPPETYQIRLGDRNLVVAADRIKYQMLSDQSFGIHVAKSMEDLVIPVKGK